MKRFCVAVAACAALTGCKVLIDADVYTADVMDALEGTGGLTTPMVLSFEAAGTDGCIKVQDGLTEPLEVAYGAVEFIGCNQIGFNTFAQFRVAADLVDEVINEQSDSDQPVYVGARRFEDGSINIAFWVNRDAMTAFRTSIPEELTQYRPQTANIDLSATVANDLREPVDIRTYDVFVDGQPSPGKYDWQLARRDEVKIELSDVLNAAVSMGQEWASIAYIPTPTPPATGDEE